MPGAETSYGCVYRGPVDVIRRCGSRMDIDNFPPFQPFVILRYITPQLRGKKKWGRRRERERNGERVRGREGRGCKVGWVIGEKMKERCS